MFRCKIQISFRYLEMSPFRWPLPKHDIKDQLFPDKIDEWDSIAFVSSSKLANEDKTVVLSGRACEERLCRDND